MSVCPNIVARLLHQMGYALRLNHKQISTDSSPDRNLQLQYLAELCGRFQRRHLPVISVDTKKRELVGNFRNAGRRWERSPRRVFDHDFRTDSIGVTIPMAFTTSPRIAALSSSGFPTTLPPLPLMASPIGGSRKAPIAMPARANFSYWPTPATATAIAVMPGKLSFSPNWPTPSTWPSPWPTIRSELPNVTRSNIASSRRFRETGLANRSTPTRRFSTIPEPPKPKPASPSPPTSIAANTHAVSSPPRNKSHPYDCTAMRRCQSGTTPSSFNCEFVFARGLRSPQRGRLQPE